MNSQLKLASTKVKNRASSLREELEKQSSRLESLARKERLERRISETVSYAIDNAHRDLNRFASGLKEYAQQFSQDPASEGIRQSLKEQPIWQSIDAWNQLVADWKNDRGPMPPEVAKARAEQCEQFLKDHPSFPGAALQPTIKGTQAQSQSGIKALTALPASCGVC